MSSFIIGIGYGDSHTRKHPQQRMHAEEMLKIMQGCILGLERLTPAVFALIKDVRIEPKQTPSGHWPEAPAEPIDFDIRIVLGSPPSALTKAEEIVCSFTLSSTRDPNHIVWDRLAAAIMEQVNQRILAQVEANKRNAEVWERIAPHPDP